MFNNINLDLVNDLQKSYIINMANKKNITVLNAIDIIATRSIFRNNIFEFFNHDSENNSDTCIAILKFFDTFEYTKNFHPIFDCKNNQIIFQF